MSTNKAGILACIISLIFGCSEHKQAAEHIGTVEICTDTIKGCYYSNDICLFNNSLYVMVRNPDTLVVYDIDRKSTHGIHLSHLSRQGNHIYADADFIYISCDSSLYFFRHNGEFVKTLDFPFNGQLGYFFISKNKSILGFWKEKTFLFDANGKLIRQQDNPMNYDAPFTSDGDKVYCGNDNHLFSFETTPDSVIIKTLSTAALKTKGKELYLSTLYKDRTVWFDYFSRDSLFIFDKALVNVERKMAIGKTFRPTETDIELETGNPLFTVFPNGKELVLIRSYKTSMEVFKVSAE